MEIKRLATVINQQNNPNYHQLNTWSNLSKALDWGDDSYGSSYYTKKDGESNKPWVLTAHNYKCNLPSQAYIQEVTFKVRMRTDKAIDVPAPNGFFAIYGSYRDNNEHKSDGTGWNGGMYNTQPSNYDKISNNWKTFEYTIKGADLVKAKWTASNLNSNICGIDLRFKDANVDGDFTARIDVAFVFIYVKYVVPNHLISFKEITKPEIGKPLTGNNYKVDVIYQQTVDAMGGTPILNVALPYGSELVEGYADDGSTFNPATMKWQVNGNGVQKHTLHLTLKPYVVGLNELVLTNSVVGKHSYKFWTDRGVSDGYDNIKLSLEDTPHLNHPSCIFVSVEGYSDDGLVAFAFSDNKDYRVIGWDIAEPTKDVSRSNITIRDGIVLNVPTEERFTAYLKCCFVPKVMGTHTVTVNSNDYPVPATLSFDVVAPYIYHIGKGKNDESNYVYRFISKDISLNTHRIASDVETDTLIIPLMADEGDAMMTQSNCGFSLNEWEELDYIGCVPLEHLHFKPKSTYKDTLINTDYKNKKYMGKKLSPDEDITLNVRLHPHQVTTVQGLIDMDKPIPINANHRCFEGDSLNHRGWAEIYSIKTEETNPHWYKCDIDVKYLTHNLNTRFNIIRGNKVNTYPTNDLMVESFDSGDSLSTDETNYFKVDTDGTYLYVDDITVDSTMRNIFSIDNDQFIDVKTRNPLTQTSKVSFEWNSALLDELRENNISRIIRLVDKDGNSLFEYEYTDFVFSQDETTLAVDKIECTVVSRVNTIRGWETTNNEITLRTEIDNDGSLSSDDMIEAESTMLYGSTLHFKLNGNKLNIVDEGFTGREYISENSIELLGDTYYWETVWKNNNADAETSDSTSYFDFIVQDSMLDTDFATKYPLLIVSPFPVSNKKLLFIREGEEGSLYYYEDDGEEFSYLIEPYYQYHNGTDLVSDSGISIFNLNYGYEIVYIQNGLVRLGFNRLNGELYLGKYDPTSHSYITTHNLKLSKYSDINIKSITDDKIELQASDTIFTIWRGHPYVMINHPTEDILIDTKFNRVWAEGVGDDPVDDYPAYYDLLNNSNLMASCVGKIDTDCLEISEENDTSKTATSIDWNIGFDDIVINQNKTFVVSGTIQNPVDTIDMDSQNCIFGDLTITEEVNHSVASDLITFASNNTTSTSKTVDVYAKLVDGDGEGIKGRKVDFYEYYEPTRLYINSDKKVIKIDENDEIYAKLVDSDGSGIPNTKVDFYENITDMSLNVTASNNIISTGRTSELYCTVMNRTQPVTGVKVDFYEEATPSKVSIDVVPDTTKINGTVDIYATVQDSDGSLIQGELVEFYEYHDFRLTVTITPEVIQSGDTSNIKVKLTDMNNHPIEDATIELYSDYDFVDVSSNKITTQIGETSTIKVKLSGFPDVSGETVELYSDNILLEAKANKKIMQIDETNTITVKLNDLTGVLADKEVELYADDILLKTTGSKKIMQDGEENVITVKLNDLTGVLSGKTIKLYKDDEL